MLNQVILVGRLSHDLEIKEIEENRKELDITLAVLRSFKNSEGIFETDFITCKVYDNAAIITFNELEYCKKGDLLGVRGRLQVVNDNMVVIVDRVTFLSSKSNN